MATVTRTLPDFSTTVQAPIVLATGSAGTPVKINLKEKRGATFLVRIGRRVVTALTRGGYVMIRNTKNDTVVSNSQRYDVISQIATAVAPTVSSGGAVGTNTVTLSNTSGINIGDILCFHTATPDRVEFHRVFGVATPVITTEQNFLVSHNSGDVVTNFADDRTMYVEGGDIMYVNCMNNSGQSLVFDVHVFIDNGDTIT
jgi:hypothetical protein